MDALINFFRSETMSTQRNRISLSFFSREAEEQTNFTLAFNSNIKSKQKMFSKQKGTVMKNLQTFYVVSLLLFAPYLGRGPQRLWLVATVSRPVGFPVTRHSVHVAVRVSSLAERSFLRLFLNSSLGMELISFTDDITLA